jgi:hypothetical protein
LRTSGFEPTVTLTVTWVAPGVRPETPSVRPLNIDTAAAWATVAVCCSMAGVSAASAAASAAAFNFV